MAELTPWTEVSASWMSVWGDEDDISIKNEEFDVQNGTNNSSITFDIDSDLINVSANIAKETNCSTNSTFVDICHGLDLDVAHLPQDHHVINNVSHEEIVPTSQTIAESSPDIQLIDQDHILNNHQEIKVMTEQELATEYLMNSVNLMKATKHNNENLMMDMPLDEMYSSASNLSSTTDVDQMVEEKIEINTNDLMMGMNLDGHPHHAHNFNQLTQQCLNDLTYQQNGSTLSDNFKNRLHYVKYINRDGKHVKIWECGVCNKEFGHQYTLMRHLPTHTDERKFQCNTCGKAFRQMSTLSQHRAIHSADRPYVCELCRKTFNRVSTLISHRKTHSGLKPHQCHLCHKAFHQKGNLRNHIFTHTNERPYKCDVCQKGFNQMSNLMCHKLKAHQRNDKPKYMCRLCNKEFPKRMALRNHEEYKHGIKNQQQATTTSITASPSATSLSGLPTSINNFNINNDLLLQQSVLGGINTTGSNTLLMNGNGGTPTGLNGAGDSCANDFLGQDKMRIIHIPDIGGSIQSVPTPPSTKVRYTNGVLVDAINTEAMRQALQAQQANGTSSLPSSAPFALLRPIGGIPVLVRVLSAPHGKHMLVPATAEDLKAHGKITISDNPNGNGTGIHLSGNNDPSKNSNTTTTVQIKIPVVATVVQKFEPDGTMSMSVESPGPDNRQLIQDSINNAVDNHLNNTNNIHDNDDSNMEFLKESCDNMSISLPNSSGYMSFHGGTSTPNISVTTDIQDLDTTNVTPIKDDITNSTLDSIDLSIDEQKTTNNDQQYHHSLLNNNSNHLINYNNFNTDHHILTSDNQLRLYNNQFHTYQVTDEDLTQHKTNDQHFNIQTTNNNNNLILNEHNLYNDVNQHFTFITNNSITNNPTTNTNNQQHIVHDENDQIKFDIL